jgi:hypothetical protein
MTTAWRCAPDTNTERQSVEDAAESVTRLAAALETTVADLILHAPSDWLELQPVEEVKVLGPGTCRRLLESETVGRVGFAGANGVMVLPVNYVFCDGRVLFRTSRQSPLSRLDGARVSFEIDGIDAARRSGWSVLVAGTVRTVIDPMGSLACSVPEPWAAGVRNVFAVIHPDRISGREVGPGDFD